jgi:solute carrier family 8 (sodium/calcium exchanger)
MGGPLICEPGGGGLFLPLFGEAEQQWNPTLRAVLYFAGLMWSFLGVAIVADIFMAAIEQVTSKQKPITMTRADGTQRTYYVHVWNGTVANLTLMALGSSAPEILLAVIETLTNNFYSGDLGPSTIVGSAAYNLMCIIALCVMVIPDGESRSIAQYGVFLTTSFFSIFAYLWLAFILLVWTPSIVTVAEGLITFALFPLLVAIAYLVDVGAFAPKPPPPSSYVISVPGSGLSEADMFRLCAEIRAEYPTHSKEALAAIVAQRAGQRMPKSRMVWRVNATRAMTGGKRVIKPSAAPRGSDSEGGYAALGEWGDGGGAAARESKSVVGFSDGGLYSVSEGQADVEVVVTRHGNLQRVVVVRYKTFDGTAEAHEDYRVGRRGEAVAWVWGRHGG